MNLTKNVEHLSQSLTPNFLCLSFYLITWQKIDLTMFWENDNVCKILVKYKTHNWYHLIIPTLHLHLFPLCSDLIYCNGNIYMLWAYMLSLWSHGCGRRQLAGASMITSAFHAECVLCMDASSTLAVNLPLWTAIG